MAERKKIAPAFYWVIGLICLLTVAVWVKWPQICSYKRMVWYYYHHHTNKVFPENYLETISTSQKGVLEYHLSRCLSSLRKADEKEVAAAVNDYLFQFLILKDNLGRPHEVLSQGHSICGGHATTMCSLLSLAQVESRLAYLLSVPYQGAHSMVQVKFKDGTQGLYDPTFGVFWSVNGNPLGVHELVANPKMARDALLSTRSKKRQSFNDEVVSLTSIKDSYDLDPLKDDEVHYQEMFAAAKGAGVANRNDKEFVRISIDSVPFIKSSLNLLKGAEDRYISWAHELGCNPQYGYDVAHIYEISCLSLEQHYDLVLTYYESFESNLSLQVLGGKIIGYPYGYTYHMAPDNYSSRSDRKIRIPIQGDGGEVIVIINNSGFMCLGTIGLVMVDDVGL